MHNGRLPLVLGATFFAGVVVACVAQQIVVPPARAESRATRWEYTCEELPLAGTAALNRFGAQGWELATHGSVIATGTTMATVYCFKRPLP